MYALSMTIIANLALPAQYIEVPVEVQYPLLLKILTFDRNLKSRVGAELVLGVVYQGKYKASEQAKNLFIRQLQQSAINRVEGIPIRPTTIDLDQSDLGAFITAEKVDLLYILPLRAYDLAQISQTSSSYKVLTLTGVPAYVEAGMAVGIGVKGDRPQIIINLSAAKKAGADFSSQILKLAKVIQ